MKLDAHQHFWSYDAAQYPWIPAGTPLHRDWLPPHLEALQSPLGIDGSIAVQARQSLAESRWLLTLADHAPGIKAVVGWADLRSPEVDAQLAELARHPKFAGVRHVVQEEKDDEFMLRPEFLRGIAALAEHRLRYDILIHEHQLPQALGLVRKFPAQPFVVDHIAKPRIRDGALDPWRARMRELAAFQNVMVKVSGMVTEADPAAWKPEDLRPYLDVVFEAFGPERLMWGSDWPVCLLAASYERTFAVVDDYTRHLTAAQRDAVLGGNCERFYLRR